MEGPNTRFDYISKKETAVLTLKQKKIRILPPIGKKNRFQPMTVTVIHADEINCPSHRKPVSWKLMTNMPIADKKSILEKLNWYALRWRIEVFHKILKSGCRAEHSKLRTAQRLTNVLAMYCITGWRIFWMTMISREYNVIDPETVFTNAELKLLDQIFRNSAQCFNLIDYTIKVAMLGGYLSRKADPPPGNLVIWRGFSRLQDIQFGYELAMR